MVCGFASEFGRKGRRRGEVTTTTAAKVAYSAAPVFYIKGGYLIVVSSFSVMSTADMEVVIDFEFLKGRQGKIVVKELSVAANNMNNLFRFKSPYTMTSHCSDVNGLNWEDGHIAYHDLYMVVSEAVAEFAHLYCYGITNANFSPNCWVALFLTCRISTVLSTHPSIIHSGAACLVTNFQTSIALPKSRIPSTLL